MTVKELFCVINTDYPSITIFDCNNNIIYQKEKNTVITRIDNDILISEVDWIYKIDSTMIDIRIEKHKN